MYHLYLIMSVLRIFKRKFLSFPARLEQIRNTSGLGTYFENSLPALSHRGNMMSIQEDDSKSTLYFTIYLLKFTFYLPLDWYLSGCYDD